MSRQVIKISGEQGMGIDSTGMIVMKALKKLGFSVFGEREFNSLIKGGRSSISINFSTHKVRSNSNKVDIALGVDREGVLEGLESLKQGGILIHGFERWQKAIRDLPKRADKKNLTVILVPAREIALKKGGNIIMTNTVLLGFLWKVLDLPLESLKEQIGIKFAKKPALLPLNYACCEGGYEHKSAHLESVVQLNFDSSLHSLEDQKEKSLQILIDGNSAIGLGAIQAGVRTYFAYPMSPSTSILNFLAKTAPKTGMLVKQLEDEISVAQDTIGASSAGTRAMCATSGGGFDLMTETVSLAGMIEVPLVIVIAQRPGPATGLPTWTGQGDLNLAVFGGHGEYAKIVLGCSDADSCFILTQKAHNLAEKYQVPVIILTEATIGMSYTSTPTFKENQVPIQRNITINEAENQDPDLPVSISAEKLETQNYHKVDKITSDMRFKLTENGISHRWIPGSSKTIYFANGDEHDETGTLTEEGEVSKKMIQKRIIKNEQIIIDQLEPEIFSNQNHQPINLSEIEDYDIGIIGWGSTKNAVLDCLEQMKRENNKKKIAYLHVEFLWPLNMKPILKFFEKTKKTVLIEGNYTGQLGDLILQRTDYTFDDKFLKWDGRSFYMEEVREFLEKVNK